ncbi:EamA family transporter [Achromobacter spanius]|uniref:EamA family transporter n=1 Tax=Achromobacter spanius TaxID=217203 RepID=A0A2S0IDE8_9BURK|nr:EamA family transporter [Achromobacter spanius]AVJ29988.1 EamA family transporter [Achromobacter spanius]
MSRNADLFLTALAPTIWGSTYVVTTLMLPPGYPLTVAMLRALPAGILLLLWVRALPHGVWWLRVFVLGALNFSVFWALLFVAAYHLPGGVAATLGAIQPLVVIALARLLLGFPVRGLSVVAALAGLAGVALLVLTPKAALDPVGVAAGLASAVSMALGTVLSRRWQPPVSALAFTSWQLTAGGVLLIPVALLAESPLPQFTLVNVMGIAWLGLVGAALTYALWFRGVARLEPAAVSSLGFLSPLSATVLGWAILDQSLSPLQLAGMAVVVTSVWLSQRAQRQTAPAVAPRAAR